MQLKQVTLAVLTSASLTSGCITTAPLPDCEAKVAELLKSEIFPAKQCLGIVDQKLVASSDKVAPSMMLIVLCGRTVELVGLINTYDEELMKGIRATPNTKFHGQCKYKEGQYEVVNTSVDLPEQRAEEVK
jgi:hypothetical protein